MQTFERNIKNIDLVKRPTTPRLESFDRVIAWKMNEANRTFTRNTTTLDYDGSSVAANVPRRTEPAGYCQRLNWESWLDLSAFTGGLEFYGHGFDSDNQAILQVIYGNSAGRLIVVKDGAIQTNKTFSNDLMEGTVSNTTYFPRDFKVIHGLLVAQCERIESSSANGISILSSDDYGVTWSIVADVAALASNVADGNNRGRDWAVCVEPVTEGSRTDFWYSWADYQFKADNPKGGQIGLARFTRTGEQTTDWTDNHRLLYERWEASDSGGLHFHAACVKSGGVLYAAGDVSYRNYFGFLEFDLDNWLTDTITHSEIHGNWSTDTTKEQPSVQPVQFQPGPTFGTHFASGDESGDVVLLVGDISDPTTDDLTIESPVFKLKDTKSGTYYEGFAPLDLKHVPGMGYVTHGDGQRVFSHDGLTWAAFNRPSAGGTKAYADPGNMYVFHNDIIYKANKPPIVALRSIDCRKGGTNLITGSPSQQLAPSGTSEIDRVSFDGTDWVFDTGNASDATIGENVPENAELKAANTPFDTDHTIFRLKPGSNEAHGRHYLTPSPNSVDFSTNPFLTGWFFVPASVRGGIRPTIQFGPGTGGSQNLEVGHEFHETNVWRGFVDRYTGGNTNTLRAWTRINSATSGDSNRVFYCAFTEIANHDQMTYPLGLGGSSKPDEVLVSDNLPTADEYTIAVLLYRDRMFRYKNTAPMISFVEDSNNFVSIQWGQTELTVNATFGGVAQAAQTITTSWQINQFVEIGLTKDSSDNVTLYFMRDNDDSIDSSVTWSNDFRPATIRNGNEDSTTMQPLGLTAANYIASHYTASQFLEFLQRPLARRLS